MQYPSIIANLTAIEENARTVFAACHSLGVSVAAVNKVTCGDTLIAKILDEAGADMIGDSRLQNLEESVTRKPKMLLRIGSPFAANDAVRHADYSLQSEEVTINALGRAAQRQGKKHKIILLIDVGDLREGLHIDNKENILRAARQIAENPALELSGIGTNLSCFGGIVPDAKNLGRLAETAQWLRRETGAEIPLVSGGNSSSLHLVFDKKLPEGINHLRLGESILLGMNTYDSTPFEELRQDTFIFRAEICEVQMKPSLPHGHRGPNAFGEKVHFKDEGPMLRGILAAGRQDVDEKGLTPLHDGARILGASSDHLIVDLTLSPHVTVGDTLDFRPAYGAVLRAYTSSYVHKEYVGKQIGTDS